MDSANLSDFITKVKNLKLLARFPLNERNIEEFLNNQAFNFSLEILSKMEGSGQDFFYDYLRDYELKDIKNAIYGRTGRFLLFKEGIPAIEEIDEELNNTPWKEAWKRGYKRYQSNGEKMDIEFNLESEYYSILLNSLNNLYWSDKKVTREFLKNWIRLVNRLWYHRLSSNYNLEDFEIKQYIASRSIIPVDYNKITEIERPEFNKALYELCYDSFKEEMFTMASILAFFNIFKIELQRLLAIYNGLKYNINTDIIRNIVGEG